MFTTDPIGDLITRIRNAQMRRKEKITIPARACAPAFSKCSPPKASSAAIPRASRSTGRTELEIELKYFDGEPVIREISRVSKPGRRV